MDESPIEPLSTGQRIRQEGWKRLIRKWMRRVLRNRLLWLVVTWVVKAIMELARHADD